MKKIIIVAGEASSDLHGANLVKAIKTLDPDIEFFGLGGPLMRAQGVQIAFDIVNRALIGIIEVVTHIGYFRKVYHTMINLLDKEKPDLAILIDYPGFNLRFAKELKKRGIPIIYYISPQVWAWGKNRIKTIKRLIDKMIVIFKFEKSLYESYGIDCEFVGHPLLDIAKPTKAGQLTRQELHLSDTFPIISLLPGSRQNEIKRILPIMLQTASLIKKSFDSAHFVVIKAPSVPDGLVNTIIHRYAKQVAIKVCENNNYNLLTISDFALVCSGTATLETAIIGTPMAVLYKVGFFSGLIMRSLIKIPHIALVNVIAGKKIVPEFIQEKAKPRLIANKVFELLCDVQKKALIKKNLCEVKETLFPSGASERAAKVIIDYINRNALP
ncbi:MAG: lipid-A-disaccharide synthase [Candidatus Omnitrophota bacterium]